MPMQKMMNIRMPSQSVCDLTAIPRRRNREFQSETSPGPDDDKNAGFNENDIWINKIKNNQFVLLSATPLKAVWAFLSDRAPNATDNILNGFTVGMVWINRAEHYKAYKLHSVNINIAIWIELN